MPVRASVLAGDFWYHHMYQYLPYEKSSVPTGSKAVWMSPAIPRNHRVDRFVYVQYAYTKYIGGNSGYLLHVKFPKLRNPSIVPVFTDARYRNQEPGYELLLYCFSQNSASSGDVVGPYGSIDWYGVANILFADGRVGCLTESEVLDDTKFSRVYYTQ